MHRSPIHLDFVNCRPYQLVGGQMSSESHSGIYIWGFKFNQTNSFLPYYVGIARRISIVRRIIHHYENIPVNYKIFKKAELEYFYYYLNNSALPKIDDPIERLFYVYNPIHGANKSQPNSSVHIDNYLNHFYFTYAHINIELTRRDYEFIETYVKYSLPNQTVSKAWSIDGQKFQQEMNNYSVFIKKHAEINFKSTPTRF